MDDVDIATTHIEQETELRLQNRKRLAELPACGTCYNCEARVHGALLFCDQDCARDHEWEHARRAKAKFISGETNG
jgi:hypothetical protein